MLRLNWKAKMAFRMVKRRNASLAQTPRVRLGNKAFLDPPFEDLGLKSNVQKPYHPEKCEQ
jgi:hypothetical protein